MSISAETKPQTFKYDVAISFLNNDLDIALSLRDGLAPQVSVFLYVDRQREIAGSDGLVTFRAAFRSESRLAVVLFRDGWGETSWTGVEKEAVQERFLAEGPDFLFFVMLDESNSPPPWLPSNRIRFSMKAFGLEQAIGAIKYRLQEIGAVFRRESLIDRAGRQADLLEFSRETEALLGSEEGIRENKVAVVQLVAHIEKLASGIQSAAKNLGIEFSKSDQSLGIGVRAHANGTVAVVVGWQQRYVNTLQDSRLIVYLFDTHVILPGETGYHYLGSPPEPIQKYRFTPNRIRDKGWCWQADVLGSKNPEELAEWAMGLLLDQIGRGGKPDEDGPFFAET